MQIVSVCQENDSRVDEMSTLIFFEIYISKRRLLQLWLAPEGLIWKVIGWILSWSFQI